MRFKIIKKCIYRASSFIDGVRNELEIESIKESLGYYGDNSYIDVPVLSISKPENVFLGDKTYICRGVRLDIYDNEGYDDVNKLIKIGNGCYIAYNFSVICNGNVEIEDNVLIASNVLIVSERHGINPEFPKEYMHQPLKKGDVCIHKGAYIGEKVIILPDVSIGEKSIIGAGSVVTRSIPDYCIAVGNPARVVKKYCFKTKRWVRLADEKEFNNS